LADRGAASGERLTGRTLYGYGLGSVAQGVAGQALSTSIVSQFLFLVIGMPALLVFYVQARVAESPVWLTGAQKRLERSTGVARQDGPGTGALLKNFLPTFLFLILLMTAFMSFSHGTQDVYPTFLTVSAKLKPSTVGLIGVLYGVGSILGGFVFGTLSERWGRKRAIVTAALLSIPVIPLWAYGHSALILGAGAVVMQFMVQGAWGVVPAYLTELSPAPVRATAPGLAYQLGGLVTSWNGKAQALAAERWGNYPAVLAITVIVVALALAGLALMGREAKGQDMTVV